MAKVIGNTSEEDFRRTARATLAHERRPRHAARDRSRGANTDEGRRIHVGRTADDHAKGTKGTIELLKGKGEDETVNGQTIEAWNFLRDLPRHSRVYVAVMAGDWELIAVPVERYAKITSTYLEQGSTATADLLAATSSFGDPSPDIEGTITVYTRAVDMGKTTMIGVVLQDEIVEVVKVGERWCAIGAHRTYTAATAVADVIQGASGGITLLMTGYPYPPITMDAYSLSGWKTGDRLAGWWNPYDCNWEAAQFDEGELGCGLKKDESTDFKLSVDLEEIAGFGLMVNASGDCPVLDLNCAVVYACVADFIPVAGCGIVATGDEPPVWNIDNEALAGLYLNAGAGCSLAVDLPAVITGLTGLIAGGFANGLVGAILDAILGNNALRAKFCKLACKCTSDPPTTEPPECSGNTPIYTCSGGEWTLSDDCGCELPTPPEGTCDECDDPTEGECCGENSTTWRWEP